MGILKKILFIVFLYTGNLLGQAFTYSYVDPCTKDLKTIFADMNSPIMVVYYGQVRSFTYTQLQDGTFDIWMNDIYTQYQSKSPCQGAAVTTTTTTSTNQVSNIINNIMTLTNLDFSSLSNASVNIGSSTSTGTDGINNKDNGKTNTNTNGSINGSQSSGSNTNTNGDANGSQGQGSQGTGDQGGGQVDGTGNSGNVSSNGGNGNTSSSSSNGTGNGGKGSEKTEDKVVEENNQTQSSNQITSAASKAKTETQKPAILLTGDIVGIQKTEDGSNDARATMSYTRVKGDGTASLGLAADFMINAKIGNISGIRSWIGTNKHNHKHINLVSGQLGLMPGSVTGTGLAIRVNSINKFTALYGVAGTYGILFEEPLINTLAIGGFMYKGKLTKHLDATVIAAGIYSPYIKYYTESVLKNKPVVIPFLNLNYKLTKTFGIGLTGGGTYVANQNVINYQILLGAKLKL